MRPTALRYPVACWRGPCRAGRAPAARATEGEPAGRRSRSKARTYGCPERRELRCSERSRHCCSGRPRLGAAADPAERGRSTAHSRTSPSRPGPPTRRSTGASKPPRTLPVFAADSPCPPTAGTALQPSAILGADGVPHPREQALRTTAELGTGIRSREVRVGACEGVGLRSRIARRGIEVKKLLVVIGPAGLVLMAVTAAAGARSEAARIQIVATMAAGDEVPAPKGDVGSARGSFTATVTKADAGAVLNWQLSFGNLTGDAVAAH